MKFTDAEWHIMKALWQEAPASARQIAERLPSEVSWAYTTIKTMLNRLKEKEAVSEHKQGNTSLYAPLVSQSRARQGALRSLLSNAFDGALGPLMHCLVEEDQLSTKQRQTLQELLDTEEQSS